MMKAKILIVEDDKDLREFLRNLLADSYSIELAENGLKAIKLAETTNPDLVILDLGLPDIDGKTVAAEIRKAYPSTIIIMLTARHTTESIVEGLELADDYLAKPFVSQELLARIKTRLRQNKLEQTVLTVDNLTLDKETLVVRRDDKKIDLTKTEFELLAYLMANKGKVLSRETILNKIWLYSPDMESRVVDVYIGYLRKKIDKNFSNKLIRSVRGFGYSIGN